MFNISHKKQSANRITVVTADIRIHIDCLKNKLLTAVCKNSLKNDRKHSLVSWRWFTTM